MVMGAISAINSLGGLLGCEDVEDIVTPTAITLLQN